MKRVLALLAAIGALAVAGPSLAQPFHHDDHGRSDHYDRRHGDDWRDGHRHHHRDEWRYRRHHHEHDCYWRHHHRFCD
jgi:Ni/Co efflux regulator RcnB